MVPAPATPACLKPLAAAVWADQAVVIDYESWRGEKSAGRRTAWFGAEGGARYMVARGRKRHAIYRVESIHAIGVLQKRKVQRRNFHLAQVWQQEVSPSHTLAANSKDVPRSYSSTAFVTALEVRVASTRPYVGHRSNTGLLHFASLCCAPGR